MLNAPADVWTIENVPLPLASDDEMIEAPPSRESSPPVVPDDADEDEDEDRDAGEEDGDDGETSAKQEDTDTPAQATPAPDVEAAETPAQDSNPPSRPDTPSHLEAGRMSAIPRKRRIGRPPKNRPPDWNAPDGSPQIQVSTPVKRRRGRPAASGGRWGRGRGGSSHTTQVPIDKEGNMMDVIDDEVAVPPDPEGDTKVDKYNSDPTVPMDQEKQEYEQGGPAVRGGRVQKDAWAWGRNQAIC